MSSFEVSNVVHMFWLNAFAVFYPVKWKSFPYERI